MTGKSYRLPSEAEWEYVCRAGTTGAYAGDLNAMAWLPNNSGATPHPVGQKQPNAFGIFDMHGNVLEWCEDVWHDNYIGAPTDGRSWMSDGSQDLRVARGGSWNTPRWQHRSAYRSESMAGDPYVYGLRVVMSAGTLEHVVTAYERPPVKISTTPSVVKPSTELIEQITRDKQYVKECIVKCGAAAVTNIFQLKKVELNADNNPEFLVEPTVSSPDNCDCVLCGARRCPQWLYRMVADNYELLLEAEGSDGISPLTTVTNGYRNVRVLYPGGNSYPAWEEIYKFDGSRYQKRSQRDLK